MKVEDTWMPPEMYHEPRTNCICKASCKVHIHKQFLRIYSRKWVVKILVIFSVKEITLQRRVNYGLYGDI